MVLRLLILLAGVASAAAVRVRLINEFAGSDEVALLHGQAESVSANVHGVSEYMEVPEGASVELVAGAVNQSVALLVGAGTRRQSVFVAQGQYGLTPTVLADSFEVPSHEMFDTARVRVLNGFSSPVVPRGVTTDCYKCLRPYLSLCVDEEDQPLIQPGSTCGYSPILTAHDFEFELDVASVLDMSTKEVSAHAEHAYYVAKHEYHEHGEPSETTARVLWKNTDPSAFPGLPWYTGVFGWREHGVYTVVVEAGDVPTVRVLVDRQGDRTWVPLVVATAVVLLLCIVYTFGNFVGDACMKSLAAKATPTDATPATPELDTSATSLKPLGSGRIRSIDTFRGIALSIMVFVNYGGGEYWWLNHSAWNGLTVADLVFPWFIFLMGTSMAISLSASRRRGLTKWQMTSRLVPRALKLYAIGLFLNGGMDLENWRVLGVLQYFGAAALFNGILHIWLPKWAGCSRCQARQQEKELVPVPDSVRMPWRKELLTPSSANGDRIYSRVAASGSAATPLLHGINGSDIEQGRVRPRAAGGAHAGGRGWISQMVWSGLEDWVHFALIGACLLIYLLVQFFLPVPGCPTGYIGPGGISEWGKYPTCTGGAHRYIDYKIYGPYHMYHNSNSDGLPVSAATCQPIYGCPVYDPEGTLGYLTSTTIAFLGLQAGLIVVRNKDEVKRRKDALSASPSLKQQLRAHAPFLVRWFTWGLVLGAVGTGLAGGTQNDGVIPISKNLWSPSFIAVMAGTGMCVLATLFVAQDIRHSWRGAPFVYVGMNSILVYAFSEILQYYFPFSLQWGSWYIEESFPSHTMALTSNIIGVGVWQIIAYKLHEKKMFFKL